MRDGKAKSKLVSFSGIDGAGKSTQIEVLIEWLRSGGMKVDLLTFWDNVVVLSRFRENLSHRVFKGDKGIGSPERPLNRRDKNVTSGPVTALRFFLYLLDALNLRRKVLQARHGGADVVIFDRYIYDELANLPLQSPFSRTFIRFLLWLAPAPDVAYIIDADPVEARRRKPEYPLDFIHKNREAYLQISRIAGTITVVGPGSVDEIASRVKTAFARSASVPNEPLARQPAVP